MKQLIIMDKGDVRMVEVPVPQVTDDGILVKIARAGICGSDIHGYTKGPLFGGLSSGEKFGHEMVGTIVELGKNVKDFQVGERVWVDPLACVTETKLSCQAGAFAEYVCAINPVKNKYVFVLPDELSFDEAVLLEPGGVGVHTKNRSGATKDDNVLIYGAGPIALMCWAALKLQGNKNVIVSETMTTRVEFAKKLGVNVINSRETNLDEYLREHFGTVEINGYERANVDVYIDCAGLGFILGQYLENGRPNSTFCTLGMDSTPLEIMPRELMSKEFSVRGSRGYTPKDIKEMIDVLLNKDIGIGRIVTGKYALDDYKAAFEAAADRNNGMKTIINICD